ncbi:MAG: ABC transporter ATP-binding protein [Clostridia bacterium]
MKKLFKYFKNYKKEIIIAPLFKFIETITELIIPIIVANMIDIGVSNKDFNYIAIWGSVVVGLNIIGIITSFICQKYAARVAVGFGAEIRQDMFAHINTFSHAELDKFGTATLNNRITHDVNRVETAVGMFIRMVARTPFLIIGSAIMAMIINLKLSLIFLIIVPLIIAVVFIILKLTEPLYDKSQKNLDKVSEIARENLTGARVVRSFNQQDYEENKFVNSAENLRKSMSKVVNISTLLNPLTGIILNFSIIAIIWFGGFQVNIGGLSQGQIIAFINYFTQIAAALVSLANIIIAFIKAFNCADRINEVFDTKTTILEPVACDAKALDNDNINLQDSNLVKVAPITSNNIEYKIEFEHVSFAYGDNSKYAIKNLNLKIAKGETIGIIGGTGSGKSSITYLVMRFYDATIGKVRVDGKNVKDYSFQELRNKIGIVPQNAVLFRGSLRENLTWRKESATQSEIEKAIRISQSEDFVKELPDGLEHRVQAGGKNFSGGQRQRLTIARALVGDPEILILDDSASALDFATDAALRKAIKQETKNSTVLLISQRANTVKNADQIVVLDNGNIVGIGKHKELLENCSVYKEIYNSQTK